MTGHRVRLLLIVLPALALGVVRDFLFVNLNYQLDHLTRHTARSYAHSAFQTAVTGWSAGRLGTIKWALAMAFIALMSALCIALGRELAGDHRYTRTILVCYLFFGLAALGLHASAVAWASLPMEFVAVKVLHALQYPVPMLFIWVGHRLRAAQQAAG